MHAEISGTVDFKEANDHLCLARLRSLVGKLGRRGGAGDRGSAVSGQDQRSACERNCGTAEQGSACEDWVSARCFRGWRLMRCEDAPRYAAEEMYGLMDVDPARAATNTYDMREVIARVVDRSEFDEYKADFGRTLLCGYARIGGRAVGIVANQKVHQQQTVSVGPQAGSKRTEFGGVIYTESAQKAARFIMDCNQQLVPLICFCMM